MFKYFFFEFYFHFINERNIRQPTEHLTSHKWKNNTFSVSSKPYESSIIKALKFLGAKERKRRRGAEKIEKGNLTQTNECHPLLWGGLKIQFYGNNINVGDRQTKNVCYAPLNVSSRRNSFILRNSLRKNFFSSEKNRKKVDDNTVPTNIKIFLKIIWYRYWNVLDTFVS